MEIHSRRAVKYALFFTFLILAVSKIIWAQEIQGNILLAPPYPEIKEVKVEKKVKDSCADVRTPEGLIFSETGGIQNAVVWLEGDFEKAFAGEVTLPVLDQKSCSFQPHVFIVPAGQKFKILNSDPVTHDIRGFEGAKMLFRFEMGPGDEPVTRYFEKPGIYLLRCGFHTWMHSIVVSAPHRFYAVTDSRGHFVFKNVPEGSYQVHLWHETLGEAKASLEVHDAVDDFSYTFKQH